VQNLIDKLLDNGAFNVLVYVNNLAPQGYRSINLYCSFCF